ncbi:MAG: hypothetical protein IJQ53_07765 [Clostridia bacterium]|nr:hypothetical protein [Clostridia bacterium]
MIKAVFELAPCAEPESALAELIKETVGRDIALDGFEIRRRSVDARRGRARFVYTADIQIADKRDEAEAAFRLHGTVCEAEEEYSFPKPLREPGTRPVVAGFGPAGIFAALCLAESGYKPIVLERGRPVDIRARDVEAFFSGGELDENSNVQYGEGGAGAFSDGKLNTLVKDRSFRGGYVLKKLVEAGAPPEILWLAHPHVGTDKLRPVVKNIRGRILALGGEIRFGTPLEDIGVNALGGLEYIIAGGEKIKADALFLAVGQSARGIAETLYKRGAELERKPFSVGFRIEHPQGLINAAQYGAGDETRFLPPAEYKLFSHTACGRTVYSFCMCPGGSVLAAASERGKLVTNGMSLHSRAGANANSAILCEVLPSDLPSSGLFAGYEWRGSLEKAAYELGGGGFTAPAQLLGEYLKGERAVPAAAPTYPRGVRPCDVSRLFAPQMNVAFRQAFAEFGRKVRGFDHPGALITAAETRTSSPVRVLRGADRQSNIKGVYPLGEGAGYAGGIMSAAIDGIKSAEEYVLQVQ